MFVSSTSLTTSIVQFLFVHVLGDLKSKFFWESLPLIDIKYNLYIHIRFNTLLRWRYETQLQYKLGRYSHVKYHVLLLISFWNLLIILLILFSSSQRLNSCIRRLPIRFPFISITSRFMAKKVHHTRMYACMQGMYFDGIVQKVSQMNKLFDRHIHCILNSSMSIPRRNWNR